MRECIRLGFVFSKLHIEAFHVLTNQHWLLHYSEAPAQPMITMSHKPDFVVKIQATHTRMVFEDN